MSPVTAQLTTRDRHFTLHTPTLPEMAALAPHTVGTVWGAPNVDSVLSTLVCNLHPLPSLPSPLSPLPSLPLLPLLPSLPSPPSPLAHSNTERTRTHVIRPRRRNDARDCADRRSDRYGVAFRRRNANRRIRACARYRSARGDDELRSFQVKLRRAFVKAS